MHKLIFLIVAVLQIVSAQAFEVHCELGKNETLKFELTPELQFVSGEISLLRQDNINLDLTLIHPKDVAITTEDAKKIIQIKIYSLVSKHVSLEMPQLFSEKFEANYHLVSSLALGIHRRVSCVQK